MDISSLQVADVERDLRVAGLAASTVVVVMAVVRDSLVDAAAERVIAGAPVFRAERRRQ